MAAHLSRLAAVFIVATGMTVTLVPPQAKQGQSLDVVMEGARVMGASVRSRAVLLAVRRVAMADANQDGVVAAGEAAAYFAARFGFMDLDHDGALSLREFLVRRPPRRASGPEVFKTARPDAFARLDLDADGNLNREEFIRGQMFRRAAMNPKDDAAYRRRAFRALDEDGDGRLLRAEFLRAAAKQVAASDRDQDGVVTVKEFFFRLRF